MSRWNTFRRACLVAAKSPRFTKKVESSIHTVKRAWEYAGGNLFVSLSGGKDSTALAALVHEALGVRVQTAHATSAIAMPEAEDYALKVCEHLDLPLDIRIPANLRHHLQEICAHYNKPSPRLETVTVWDLLRAIPADIDITDPMPHDFILRAVSPGNMMIAWTYEASWEGSFVGLRAQESKGRGIFRAIHGRIHRHATDGKLVVNPILDWTLEEVFGFCLGRGLPLHPIYKHGIESGWEPKYIRAGDGIVSGWISSQGGVALTARMYPNWWRKLTNVRPELSRYVA